jgi:deoxyadenosine/deoxycytidine kinase
MKNKNENYNNYEFFYKICDKTNCTFTVPNKIFDDLNLIMNLISSLEQISNDIIDRYYQIYGNESETIDKDDICNTNVMKPEKLKVDHELDEIRIDVRSRINNIKIKKKKFKKKKREVHLIIWQFFK